MARMGWDVNSNAGLSHLVLKRMLRNSENIFPIQMFPSLKKALCYSVHLILW